MKRMQVACEICMNSTLTVSLKLKPTGPVSISCTAAPPVPVEMSFYNKRCLKCFRPRCLCWSGAASLLAQNEFLWCFQVPKGHSGGKSFCVPLQYMALFNALALPHNSLCCIICCSNLCKVGGSL